MAVVATERRRYTVSEFLALAADLELAGAQERFEIVEGELVAYATPDNPHMRAAIACLLFLGDAQRAGYGQAGNDRTVVLDYQAPDIPVEHAYKPDAFFVTREREAILEYPNAPSVVGAPDIVVEVLSPTTARHDQLPRGKKFKAYAQYGVRSYWLVDTNRQTLTTFERRGNGLVQAEVLRPGDTLRCPVFPELGVEVAWLFQTR
ncbi:MAG: Uma2 family endonuclease [Chloroflexota bacterium]